MSPDRELMALCMTTLVILVNMTSHEEVPSDMARWNHDRDILKSVMNEINCFL